MDISVVIEAGEKEKISERILQESGIKVSNLTKSSLTAEQLIRYERVMKKRKLLLSARN